MKLNQAGINLIRSYEGCVLHAYKPVAAEKYWTIGYGHYGPDVKQGMTISKEEAEKLLIIDLQKYVTGVAKICAGLTLNDNEFSSLCSFAYNCGIAALDQSTGMKLLRQGDKKGACAAWQRWNKGADGKVLLGLVGRRSAEKQLFLTPMPESAPAYPESASA